MFFHVYNFATLRIQSTEHHNGLLKRTVRYCCFFTGLKRPSSLHTVFITNNAITFPIKIVNLKGSPAYAFYSEAFRVQTMRASISGS